MALAASLEADEAKLKNNMEQGVEAILRPIRILLLKALAKEIEWPDMAVFDEMIQGFKIVGLQDPSGIFGLEPRPPAFSSESLDDAAKFLRPANFGQSKVFGSR